jgi:two-component system NarL family response regulator
MLLRPGRDLVLLEAHMPGLDTFSAAADIRRLRPQAKIALLTRHTDPETLARVRKHHLHGLIYKSDKTEELHYAIRRILGGGFYTPPSSGEPTDLTPLANAAGLSSLTDREMTVLTLYARGYVIKDIANELHVSVKTAETHLNNLRRKLGIPTALSISPAPPCCQACSLAGGWPG